MPKRDQHKSLPKGLRPRAELADETRKVLAEAREESLREYYANQWEDLVLALAPLGFVDSGLNEDLVGAETFYYYTEKRAAQQQVFRMQYKFRVLTAWAGQVSTGVPREVNARILIRLPVVLDNGMALKFTIQYPNVLARAPKSVPSTEVEGNSVSFVVHHIAHLLARNEDIIREVPYEY